MSKNDDSERKVINSFTKMLVDISKIKLTSNCKPDDKKKLVDAIFLYHNVQNLQPDILKTDKKFSQLYSTFLEVTLTFFPQLFLSNQLIRAVARNFTWYAKSTGVLPQSPGYCYLVFQILYNFPNLKDDPEISEFFNTVFQIPAFMSSFFFSEDINFFVNLFFYQFKDKNSVLFFIDLLQKQAVFPNNPDSTAYIIIQLFSKEISDNKKIPEERALLSINFISIYIEKLGRYYPNLINELFLKNDFNIFYTYLADHLPNESFIQFIVSLLATPLIHNSIIPNSPSNEANLNKPKENELNSNNSVSNSNQKTVANPTIFNFIIQQFVKKSIKYEIHLKLIQSLYYFIKEYNVDVNSFEPQNFFVTLYNIPTNDIPEIKDILLNFFDMLVTYNYEYSFIIFANYLNEYKKNCPFKRLSSILQRLITTFSFGNFNTNNNYYLQNLPFFFVDSFGDSPQSLGEFLSEYPIFQMLIVVLYQYNYSFKMNDPNPRLTWMKKIIECSDYFDHSNILIQMLTVDPSGDLINKYISILKDHFSPSLFNVLTTTLHQSYFLVEQFLQFRGLQTIDKLLPSLDDNLLTNLLVSISSHPFSDELNESILNLPNDHIFFHLKSSRNYYKILKNSPIRLPVFLPFVPAPPITFSQFDLMNISKYAVPIYQRFGKKVPFLFKLINRHLTYRQASEILHNNKFFVDDKTYCCLGDLIDLKADHFPLYEILPNSQNICVNLNVEITEKSRKSLLFWFKIVSPIYQPFALFHTDKKMITIENDLLKIDSNHSFKIERNVWYSCVVNNKSVKFNNNKRYFQDTSAINQCIFGQSNVDCLWILSPNVRIIENNLIEEVLNKGPQFFDNNEKYPIVAMPNESIFVDYAGLPYYFTIPLFFKNEFLNVIENCNDNDQVIGLFLLLFNEMIVNNYIEKHWPFVLHLLSTKTKFLNNYLISYIINFISEHSSSKIFESFIFNTNFWKNLSNRLLGYTLNNLLSHCNNHSNTIFEFFISFLLLEISNSEKIDKSSLSASSSQTMDDSTIQIILFFLSRLASQFPEEGFLKQIIEIVLFSEKYTFSLTVRLFFVQTALQNDILLTSKSMPKNWILKLLSYFPNNQSNDVDTFYFAVFNLLSHFSDIDIQNNFPQDSFDVTPFIFNPKYWHYFFGLLTGQSPHFTHSIINEYNKEAKTTIKMPSIIPSIISLTLHGLAVLVQINFNPYHQLNEKDEDENQSLSFLGEYVKDSFKFLNQICERLPHLFHNDSICLFIQIICPLIPNLEAIIIPNVQLSQSEKFCVNMNIQELILNETLETWKITNSFQKEIISIRPEISRFSLQSHSIIIPDRKCEMYSKIISNLIKTIKKYNINESKLKNNVSSFKYILHYTNFTQFSVNLLFANSDKFQELILYLFGFCPFNPIKLFDEYFKLPFQIFISQLNQKNLNQNLFEQILKFIIQGFKVNALYTVFSSSLSLLFMFLNNALGFINLNPNPNQNENNGNLIENSTSSEDTINNNNNESNITNLVKLVREMILLITTTGVQKTPNEILQYLFDSKNIIDNEIIFDSHQMICQMISLLHVFYLSNTSSSLLFLKILQSIWPKNDQSFKTFFISNYSNEVFDAFQNATIDSDISYLSSILKNSSKSFMKLLNIQNSEDSQENNSNLIQLDSSIFFDLYAGRVYEMEKRELQTNLEFTYLETAIDCSANLKTVLNLHRFITSYEKNKIKYFMLDFYSNQQIYHSSKLNKINHDVFPFAWPFWISRILTPFYDIELDKIQIFNKLKINYEMKNHSINLNMDDKKNSEDGLKIKSSSSFENSINRILIDYYSGNSIESESNFNFMIFYKNYISKNMGKIYAFNAQFIRNDIDVNTSVFILENKILLLLNSSIGDKFDRLIFTKFDSNEKLLNLYKIVFNFEFGKFSLFHSHPVISIPFDSILFTFEADQDSLLSKGMNFGSKYGSKNEKANLNSVVSLHIYSLNRAAFSLVASKKDLNALTLAVKPFVKSNFKSFSNIQNASLNSESSFSITNNIYFDKIDSIDLISRYENHQIAPFEFFILLNALHGRFFDDWKVPPLFPKNLMSENSKILSDSNIILTKGASQCRNAFQCYAPDFLEFSRINNRKSSSTNSIKQKINKTINNSNQNNSKTSSNNDKEIETSNSNANKISSFSNSNDAKSNNDKINSSKSAFFFINNDKFDMVKLVFDNLTALSSKNLLSNFISSEFGEKLSKPSRPKSSINIKNTANKIKKSFMKSRESSAENDNNSDDDETSNHQSNQSSSNLLTETDIKLKIQRFLSTNPHLFAFKSCSSFHLSNCERGHISSSDFDSTPTKLKSRDCVCISKKGTFAVIDCPLRCCSEIFRILYDEKNKELPVGTRHMSTFVYYEYIKSKLSNNENSNINDTLNENNNNTNKNENNKSKTFENNKNTENENNTNETIEYNKNTEKENNTNETIEYNKSIENENNTNETIENTNEINKSNERENNKSKTFENNKNTEKENNTNETIEYNKNTENENKTNKAIENNKNTENENNTNETIENTNEINKSNERENNTSKTFENIKNTENENKNIVDIDIENKNENNENINEENKESNENKNDDNDIKIFTYSVCYSNPRTIINEHDFVAVTFWAHSAVIWDIVRGLPLHIIDFASQEDIIDAFCEENHGLLAFCSTRKFFVYTINGSFVMRTSLLEENCVIKQIVSFDGFKIDYKTTQNVEKTQILYLFVNENK